MALCAVRAVPVSAAELLPVVSVELQLQDSLQVVDQLVGRVVSARRSELGFERGGRLDSIVVSVGERVVAGQALASLDVRQLTAQQREIEAQLAAARANEKSVRARLDLASATRRRQADLFERGVAAAQERDEARFGEESLRALLDAAQAAIVANEAAAERIAVALDLSVLEAPFDGSVTRRYFDEGSVLAPGVPLLAVIDRRREVRMGVPVAKLGLLSVGALYSVEVAGGKFAVRLRAVADAIDTATRTAEAIFDFVTPVSIVDGAVARLGLETRLEQPGYWLPMTALTEGRRGLWSVFVLRAEGSAHRVERRDVEVIHFEPDRAFVRGALAAGERVAIAGVGRVVPGQTVRAVDLAGEPQ